MRRKKRETSSPSRAFEANNRKFGEMRLSHMRCGQRAGDRWVDLREGVRCGSTGCMRNNMCPDHDNFAALISSFGFATPFLFLFSFSFPPPRVSFQSTTPTYVFFFTLSPFTKRSSMKDKAKAESSSPLYDPYTNPIHSANVQICALLAA